MQMPSPNMAEPLPPEVEEYAEFYDIAEAVIRFKQDDKDSTHTE